MTNLCVGRQPWLVLARFQSVPLPSGTELRRQQPQTVFWPFCSNHTKNDFPLLTVRRPIFGFTKCSLLGVEVMKLMSRNLIQSDTAVTGLDSKNNPFQKLLFEGKQHALCHFYPTLTDTKQQPDTSNGRLSGLIRFLSHNLKTISKQSGATFCQTTLKTTQHIFWLQSNTTAVCNEICLCVYFQHTSYQTHCSFQPVDDEWFLVLFCCRLVLQRLIWKGQK